MPEIIFIAGKVKLYKDDDGNMHAKYPFGMERITNILKKINSKNVDTRNKG